jgi:hypothetical protein
VCDVIYGRPLGKTELTKVGSMESDAILEIKKTVFESFFQFSFTAARPNLWKSPKDG